MSPSESAASTDSAAGNLGRRHPAWRVAGTTFAVLMLSASVRGAFSLLIEPLHEDRGWSRTSIATASTINLVLFGLMGPISAAFIIRFGLRRVVITALTTIAGGALLATKATAPWHLWLTWGGVMGIGQGCLATVLAASVASTWFVKNRAMVSGVLVAAGTAGTLVFLPFNRWLVDSTSWHGVSYTIAVSTLLAVPLVALFIRNRPEDVGTTAYGAPAGYRAPAGPTRPLRSAFEALRAASRSGVFWLLFGSFTVCGITTSGMLQVHFVDAAGDHGISRAAASTLFVLLGVFDLVGVVGSGWLSERADPRTLLFAYYALRGAALLVLDQVLRTGARSPLTVAVIALFGLDWVATVPPTVKLCGDLFPGRGPIVYGWVFAGHQLGGGAAAALVAWSRDATGSFRTGFMVGGLTAFIAALACLRIGRDPVPAPAAVRTPSVGLG